MIAAGFFLAAATTIPVEAPAISGKLALEDAVKLALTHNRDLLKALEERRAADGKLKEAWGEALPQVELDASYTRLATESGFNILDPATGENVFIRFGFLNNYRAELAVTQPLFQGGRAAAALRAARLYDRFADHLVRQATERAVYDATVAYYRVLLVQEQSKVAENSLRLTESLLKDVETKRKYGVASDFNVLRSKVEVSNARALRVAYKNQLHTAEADLFRVLGVSQQSAVELVETLEYRPETADESAATDDALRQRPDLLRADLTAQLREQAVKVARSEFFPRLEAFFRESYAKPDPVLSTQNEWGDTWQAGVSLSFPIFDGGRRSGRLMQEEAARRQAEIDRDDARERARYEVRLAVARIQDAAEAVDAQQASLDQAREGLRLAEVGYREGTLDQVDVLEARAALVQAQTLYFASLHAHAVARLDLALARGSLVVPAADGGGR